MRQRNLWKRGGTLLLAIAVLAFATPQPAAEVWAAGEPTAAQYATIDQLKAFHTASANQSAKIIFGNGGQQWWIAGSLYHSSLTLFAASPLGEKVEYDSDPWSEETINSAWGCTYPDSIQAGSTVWASHYGSSQMRRETLKNLGSSYFTGGEQKLMKDTTIYTLDSKNQKTYSTVDKLYLGYGVYHEKVLWVGANKADDLSSGLPVDSSYWVEETFWTRIPDSIEQYGVYTANKNMVGIGFGSVDSEELLVPAFALDVSSVLFASAAPAVSSDGKQTMEDQVFTLRYQGSVGNAEISGSGESIAVTDVEKDNTYLVVQNSDGAWAKKVSEGGLIFANELDGSLSDFTNCKVWLEQTTDRLTSAEEVKQGTGYHINIQTGQHMSVTSGQGTQSSVSGAMSQVTVEAEDGYYFPDGYSLPSQNGITVNRESETKLTVSGTPSKDTLIQLADAEPMPKADKPQISMTQTASSIKVEVGNHEEKFGDIEYSWDGGNTWAKNAAVLSGLGQNTERTVAVRFAGKGIYQQSEETSQTARTNPASYTVTVPQSAQADGSSNRIGISQSDLFDLGHNGQVTVKVKDTGTMAEGKLTLTRENDPANRTITSKLLVNGQEFKDISQNLAAFRSQTDAAVAFAFQKPEEADIPAGAYRGTIIFAIDYTEQP